MINMTISKADLDIWILKSPLVMWTNYKDLSYYIFPPHRMYYKKPFSQQQASQNSKLKLGITKLSMERTLIKLPLYGYETQFYSHFAIEKEPVWMVYFYTFPPTLVGKRAEFFYSIGIFLCLKIFYLLHLIVSFSFMITFF